jgi:hypothetical protein
MPDDPERGAAVHLEQDRPQRAARARLDHDVEPEDVEAVAVLARADRHLA